MSFVCKQMMVILVIGLSTITGRSQDLSFQHMTVTGMQGLIEAPSANFSSDRIGQISYAYYPEGSKLVYGHQAGKMLNVSMMLTSYFNFSLHLVNPVNREELAHGIGDRSIKIKLKVLEEKKYLPQLAIGVSDMFGVNVWQGALYIVATKNVQWQNFNANLSFGYGSDIKDSNLVNNFFFPAETFVNTPLNGLFGGTEIKYKNHSLLVDYDTQKVNAGYSYLFQNKWVNKYLPSLRLRVGIYTLGFNSLSAQVAAYYSFGDRIFK